MIITKDAVVAGHICLDIIPDLTKIAPGSLLTSIRSGGLVHIGAAKVAPGGSVSNTGLALHILGVNSSLMGKVGKDYFGEALLSIIRSFQPSLAEGMIVDERVPTSYSFVISPPDMDRCFLHCPGANELFGEDDIVYDQLKEARHFHFGYPSVMTLLYERDGEQLTNVYRRAKGMGVTTSMDTAALDPNAHSGKADWIRILGATLPYVDIFLPSVEELLYMLRKETYFEMLQRSENGDILPQITPELLSSLSTELLDMGVKIVCIKTGYRGLYLRTGSVQSLHDLGRAAPRNLSVWAGRELWASVFQVDVVGTTGSGDTTIAGFLTAVLRGMDPEQAVTAATAVGACNVEAADSLSGLRSWEDTLARISAGWPRRPQEIVAPHWSFDASDQLWKKS